MGDSAAKGQEKDPNEEKVFQGLQKKQKCKLCEEIFYVEELPGAISYKSVLQLRKSWGVDIHFPTPSLLYQKVKLCVFCSQFFENSSDYNKTPIQYPIRRKQANHNNHSKEDKA